jgi:hypothetical protein
LYDPKNFKKLGEARLICDDVFRGNKALKASNNYYPLLTDGKDLFALLFTVERRERAVKDTMQNLYESLKEAKKGADGDQLIKQQSTEAEKLKEEADSLAAQLKV